MSNAAKHRKKAAEFEQLKQIDRAIASYVKAIEESESAGEDIDVALFNKVGDLALRQGRVPDAITYYERAVEHYATSGLFNNAIALCNKILRNAPGRANVYFTLGRICARKGLRGDATRNFLEYATRMQQEGRVDEGMRALAEVADLMPELTEIQSLVEEHAARAGITLPRRKTPARAAAAVGDEALPGREPKSADLVFLDIDYGSARRTPLASIRVPTPVAAPAVATPPDVPVILPFITDEPPVSRAVVEPVAPAVPTTAVPTTAVPTTAVPTPTVPTLAIPTPVIPAPVVPTPVVATPIIPAVVVPPVVIPPVVIPTPQVPTQTVAQSTADAPPVSPLDGLEATGEFDGQDVPVLDGFTSDDLPHPDAERGLIVTAPLDLTSHTSNPSASEVPILDEIVVEDFQGGPTNEAVSATFGIGTPVGADAEGGVPPIVFDPTPLMVNAIIEPIEPAESNAPLTPAEAELQAEAPLVYLETPDTSLAAQPLDEIELLDIEPVPELDAAIAAGAELVARAEEAARISGAMRAVRPTPRGTPAIALDAVEEVAPPYRPPYRLDPHDFILPGELPPLILEDGLVTHGLEEAVREVEPVVEPIVESTAMPLVPEATIDGTSADDGLLDLADDLADNLADQSTDDGSGDESADAIELLDIDTAFADASEESTAVVSAADTAVPVDAELEIETEAETDVTSELEFIVDADDVEADNEDESDSDDDEADDDLQVASPVSLRDSDARPVSVTPSLPIAAVAAEAQHVAAARRDSLRSAVARMPQNWLLRRRLAEALFEAGERDAALAELETAQSGLYAANEFAAAYEIADELVQVSPDRVPYHQKRVELAVRTNDQQRLRFAYLDLADALVRLGEEARARAVYARVLEIDPYDDRARAALGAAAPPPPAPPPARPDDDFVDLADWLRDDDAPASTRMRMREPTISGDEQADFDALLRHFKDGVARSLGEDDFESHYDLGVAYKEMGLLEDAIAEFQKALRSRSHRLPAYEALGQCFVEQGRHQVAATILSRALHEPGLNDDQRVGVLYLLAYSCEALQRWDEARSYYQRVYATDIQFRDVAARLAAVEQASR
ncbi:MAG: tetratricopeptide repeat protein [Gemmatimonadaceae bacterium]|nr:tetratricopeptide repeat protein [Gemmatimonadaceae bacterium]